jgi:hypothetical protein
LAVSIAHYESTVSEYLQVIKESSEDKHQDKKIYSKGQHKGRKKHCEKNLLN